MNRFNTSKILAAGLLSMSLGLTGCLTDDDKDGDEDVGIALTTKTVVAGAQDNTTYGSSIDLDEFKTYTITVAKTMTSDIDLIFANSTAVVGGGLAVYSPDSAKYGINGSAGFDFMQDFNNPNHTVIKTINVNIDDIDTKAELDSLWEAGSPVLSGRLLINETTTFMAQSNTDRIVLVDVISVTLGSNGSANFEGVAKF
jgi:hypothetical protein